MKHKVSERVANASFHRAAEKVVKRVTGCRMVSAIGATALAFSVLGLALVAGARVAGYSWVNWMLGVGLVAGWVLGCWVWVLRRRPSGFAALAYWDERAGRNEEFASAYFFEAKEHLETSEKLHLTESEAMLKEAMGELPRDVPLPKIGSRWLLPLLVVGFALSPLLGPTVEAGDMVLTEEMREAAEEEGERIAMKENEFKKMGSLTEKEREEMEKLRQEINEAADDLKRSGEKSARDVLRELEKRARAAEKLAERIGGRGDEWASEEMLREMSEHADTVELAEAIKDKEAERSAAEAESLEGVLRNLELSNEVQDRLDEALSRVMKKATAEDHKRPVGINVGAAADDMAKKAPEMAAKDFKRLADHFRRLAEREKAEEKLRKLAEELRKSGSNIAGKNLQSMKKLAGNSGSSMKMPKGMMMPNSQSLTPMTQQNLPNMSQGKAMPIPGLKPGKAGKGMPMTFAPVPGGAKGKPVAIIPGAGNKPAAGMMAPIPGTSGSGAASMVAGNGGLQAGSGSAPMTKQATGAMEAERSGLVATQVNEDGDSAVRAVEGGERSEAAERERQETVVDFIRVQEEALDEATLPLSRKEHVLRYFTALRKRFEEE